MSMYKRELILILGVIIKLYSPSNSHVEFRTRIKYVIFIVFMDFPLANEHMLLSVLSLQAFFS